MKALHTIALVVLFISTSCYSQENIEEIENTNWSCEDSVVLENYEFMVLSFREDSLSLGYFNLLEVMSSSTCRYAATYTESFFELKLGGCLEESEEPSYIYGYYTEGSNDELNILISGEKFNALKVLKKQDGWIPYQRFE